MSKNKKNSKLDLIWIIPEIVGSLGITFTALIYMSRLELVKIGLVNWIFQVSLVLIVLTEVGVPGFSKGISELFKVFVKGGKQNER